MIDLPRTLFEPSIAIPRKDALRLSGLRSHHREPRPSVMRLFEDELAAGERLIHPKAVMASHLGGLVDSSHIPSTTPLIAAVCTIGAALEERVRDLTWAGETARAMILDAVGSAAVEALANRCNQLICGRVDPDAPAPAGRRSPGYGKLRLKEQESIFALLNPSEIGVRLTKSFMMVPRKSVSFLMPLLGGTTTGPRPTRCGRCGMTECAYREAPAAS